jgi:hypothetical protein
MNTFSSEQKFLLFFVCKAENFRSISWNVSPNEPGGLVQLTELQVCDVDWNVDHGTIQVQLGQSLTNVIPGMETSFVRLKLPYYTF